MYVVYCQNKPVSEYIVSEHLSYFDEIRQKLKHKLLVSDEFYIILNNNIYND
jgi:triple functional domain protein